MAEVYEFVVVGGGVVGAAAAETLARRGRRVVLVDQLAPGHDRGSSHGDGRIIRYTYAEPEYVAMARRAYDGWAALEAAAGETLVERTGSWECGAEGSPQLRDLEATFAQAAISYERLTPSESARRFPHFRLPPGSVALYQADGGIVRADRAVRALWRVAGERGAELVAGERIVDVVPVDERLRLRAASGREWQAERAILAAGGWSAKLLAALGLALPLAVTREHLAYFAPAPSAPDHRVGSMPTVIDYHTEQPFYALPQIDVPGVKVGWHHSGLPADPDALPAGDVSAGEEVLRQIRRYVGERLPHLRPAPIHTATCLYTNTPDYHFLFDRHPDLPNLTIGAGFSGHGFKFAPVSGEILAALASDEAPPIPLDLFRLARFSPTRTPVPRSGA